MQTIFITGANRGIGLELTHHYLKKNYQVYATCRSLGAATQLKAFSQQYPHLHIITLDVSQPTQISQLSATFANIPIDILINNAGVWGPKETSFGHIESNAWLEVLKVNTIAPALLAQALLENLQKGSAKIIANMSSSMGSIEENISGDCCIYRSSKAALNAVTKTLAIDLKPSGISVLALHPGWVKTDMGGPNALIDVQESVAGLTKVLEEVNLETHSGKFFNYKNEVVHW